jgi:hypothetical protein
MTDTLDRLIRLAAQRSARLDSLREACLPLCRLIAPLRTPKGSRYYVTEQHQRTNVGGCSWLTVSDGSPNSEDFAMDPTRESWTLDRPVSASGGWTHGDFNSPQPSGPTPRQLRDFAAWLADPGTLSGIADEEQGTAEQVDGLAARLRGAAAALKR